ncbi:hypothetical protein JOF56_000854 [Kibdelosporangium banguiense]|uniref:Uncharacterized protein n=1 Tax=Kibdelosporangium banguiense TaxID=1365924 RepID=A0ABS4T961_9PSEU|nr:hypothetical protein [Kibdelosporangium banguiense]MBP2320469.1 hypothetical protein [Kibdelosporangium banguiense]
MNRRKTPRLNKIAAPCDICGQIVPPRRGYLFRGESGSWAVIHPPAEWVGSPISGQRVGGCPPLPTESDNPASSDTTQAGEAA